MSVRKTGIQPVYQTENPQAPAYLLFFLPNIAILSAISLPYKETVAHILERLLLSVGELPNNYNKVSNETMLHHHEPA